MIRRVCIGVGLILLGCLLFGGSTYKLKRIEREHEGVIRQIDYHEEAMRARRRTGEAVSSEEWNAYYRDLDGLKSLAPGYIHYVDYHYAWVATAVLSAGLGVFVLLLPRKRRYVR